MSGAGLGRLARQVTPGAVAVLLVVGAAGCLDKKDPAAVADRFVALYYVEMNQDEALEHATGRARRMLQHELDEVRAIRATGYTAAEARPSAFFHRVRIDRQGDAARATFTLETRAGPNRVRRQIDLDLTRNSAGGTWRVSDFHQTEVQDRH
jgi:hypothetical protein